MLIAGPTPFTASALVAAAGSEPWLVAGYLVACQAVTVIAVLLAPAPPALAEYDVRLAQGID